MITETKAFIFTDDGTTGTDTVNAIVRALGSTPATFTVTNLSSKWSAAQIAAACPDGVTYNSGTQIFTYTPPTNTI